MSHPIFALITPVLAAIVAALIAIESVVAGALVGVLVAIVGPIVFMVKVSDGTTGADWYWYEILPGGRVVSDGTNDRQCTGCHSAGIDFVRTPFPLQ